MPKSAQELSGNPSLAYKARNGDDLHNYNAYRYLLVLKEVLQTPIQNVKEEDQTKVELMLSNLEAVTNQYDPEYPYGNLYSLVQRDFAHYQHKDTNDPRFIALIEAIYLNDNSALETTYETIKEVLEVNNQSSSHTEDRITDRLNEGRNVSGNMYNPQLMDKAGEKLYGVIGPTFAPQEATSLPSIRHYSHQTDSDPIEIRMGTQGQYLFWGPQVSPLFKSWLTIRHQKSPGPKGITHIYFNNLGRDRNSIEGVREKNLTHTLEELNSMDGVAVITLPADKGLFSSKKVLSSESYATKDEFSNQVISILKTGKHKDVPEADLFIPQKIKDIIYNEESEDDVIRRLLDNSYIAMGLDKTSNSATISYEEMQSVYFHLIKYELTGFILEKTQPKTFNISCKDGIDRAGSASLYYNLITSFESGSPISQEEFEKNLHGPATMVKGRGMNKHRERVWSAINQYVDANHDVLNSNPEAQWLIRWRDTNVPPARMNEFFPLRAQKILDSFSDGSELSKATFDFIDGCIKLSEDASFDKHFLMDMIYESKCVAEAAVLPSSEDKLSVAVKHMENRIEKYPEEIKQLGFLELVGKFFSKIANFFFNTDEYKGSRDKFQGKDQPNDHSLFSQFKDKMSHFKDEEQETLGDAKHIEI